ncbi:MULTISPECIES: SPOR domain-containing protein [Kocuria]|uniref:SPOR domain-containing protein n=1 Tax=Kocuria TaxID=57493 RepID=UPI000660576E|nr:MULTISPECIES: SPOR domain-containing protein [Kocuria]MCT1368444.1 SPOR domain-containing protein [Rothia sp. p3-SID1597]RUQ20500.1 SPOR domain-containing protein [Kocuria sp. HSID16901]
MSVNDSGGSNPDSQFWFNTFTHEVEEGAQSDYRQLIGPYATRAEAEHALERAQERNEDWDRSDAEWRGDA